MEVVLPALFGFLLLACGAIFLILSVWSLTTDDVSRRLSTYVDEIANQPRRLTTTISVRRAELSGSFIARAILPAFRYTGRLLGSITPKRVMEDLDRQLTIAGHPLGLGPREFYGIRLGFMLFGLWLGFLVIQRGKDPAILILALLIIMISSYLPRTWLKRRVRSRQDKIRKGLADALDMLSVCANAGLGFDQSLQRVSEYWDTAIAVEFRRTVAEMGMGLSRSEALRNMAERVDISELSSFVAVILQSDQLGMSISDTLHSQADQMRVERRYRAQEMARRIPLKMLFPMLFFILPAMFAVVLGPAIPTLVEFFRTIRQSIL